MGSIPWADWIYHLPHRRDEVNQLHKSALDDQEAILKDGISAGHRVDQYKRMVATNLLLMMTVHETSLGGRDYLQYREQVDALEPPAAGSLPAEVVSFIVEFSAGAYVLKALNRAKDALVEYIPKGVRRGIAKVVPGIVKPEETLVDAAGRSGVSTPESAGLKVELDSDVGVVAMSEGESAAPVGEETAEIEASTVGPEVSAEDAAGAMSRASLGEFAGIGIGLGLAIGIDVACAAISGAAQRDQLDAEIDKLHTAVTKMNKAVTTLTQKIKQAEDLLVKEQRRLADFGDGMLQIFGSRPEIPKPTLFGYDNHAEWTAYGTAMTRHYTIFSDLKAKQTAYKRRHPHATVEQFIDWYIEGEDTTFTSKQLKQYAELLETVSKRVYSAQATAAEGASR